MSDRSLAALAAITATFAVACDSLGTAPNSSRHPPRIVFAETAHEFGRATQGAAVTHAYRFRNLGDLDLTIENVRAACGCTAAAAMTRVIPPGADGVIDVRFDTAGLAGRETRSISIYANDPAQPVTTLTMTGEVDAVVAANPPQLYVGHVRRGQTAANDVRLVSAAALGTVDAPGKILDASLRSAGPDGQRVQVAIRSDAPLGRFKAVVAVHMRDARQSVVRIPVTGTVDDAPAAPAETK